MPIAQGKNCCGFTLLEFAVAAGLLGLLAAALLSRVLFYHAEAERVAAEQLVGTLRSALQVRAAQASAAPGGQGLGRLADENPIGWLSEKPANYLGEYYAPPLEELPSGNWFYDRRDRSLVYLPAAYKSFSFQTSKFLKFKVKLFRLPTPRGGGLGNPNQGIVLDQVQDDVAVNN
jgi:general secretion pathway protein G